MQVLHEYLILFTVKYFSNASTRLVEIVLTLGLLTPHYCYLSIYLSTKLYWGLNRILAGRH